MLEVSFLEEQSDAWTQQFYSALLGARAQWEKGSQNPRLRKKEIIRLEDGSHVAPFSAGEKSNAFLPSSGNIDLPTVKRSLLAGEQGEKARKFLRDLGLEEPDSLSIVLNLVLPKYDGNRGLDKQDYLNDLTLIAEAIETCQPNRRTDLLSELIKTPFLFASDPALNKRWWRQAKDVYQRTPELLTMVQWLLERLFCS